MKTRLFRILSMGILLFTLTACGGGGSGFTGSGDPIAAAAKTFGCESGSSPLTGCWLTEECDAATNGDGQFLGYWVRGIQSYNSDGSVQEAQVYYHTDTCSDAPFDGDIWPAFVARSYKELNTELTSDGVTGHRFHYVEEGLLDVEVVYVITASRLCFSTNFVIGANHSSITTQSGPATMNYTYGACHIQITAAP